MNRTTEKELMMKVLNHNAWTNGGLLEINSLGAGGGMGEHLIFLDTQNQLTPLLKPGDLMTVLSAIGTYDYKIGNQRKKPISIFLKEYERLRDGGKINHSFFHNFKKSMPKREDRFSIITGKSFKMEVGLN